MKAIARQRVMIQGRCHNNLLFLLIVYSPFPHLKIGFLYDTGGIIIILKEGCQHYFETFEMMMKWIDSGGNIC
jgi:hypothetical protein